MMTVRELLTKLSAYPRDTQVVLGFDWGDPEVDDTYLLLDKPVLNITNTAASQARREKQIADNATPERVSTDTGVWGCKIGEADRTKLPDGADAPLREAVEAAYVEIVGSPPAFLFSGWGYGLTGTEEEVVNEAATQLAEAN